MKPRSAGDFYVTRRSHMRSSVAQLVALGRLPNEENAGVPELQSFEAALKAIERPLSDEEALALLSVFPSEENSCFGLAWSVLHLIETSRNWPLREARLQQGNPWVKSMLARACRK
jgi:hypothetical protein